MAVPIVIHERAAGAPTHGRREQPGLLSHIRECAVAIIAIENILAPVSDEYVVETVVVIIPDSDRRTPIRSASALPAQ